MSFVKTAAASVALLALSAPVMAGEFRSGTYSDSGSSRSTRNVLSGTESIESSRTFSNVITGNSSVETVSFSATADNARAFTQSYGYATGDISAQGSLGGGGSLDIDSETDYSGDVPSLLGALFGQEVSGTVSDQLTANGAGAGTVQASIDIDGRIGTGEEVGLDGSIDFSFQEGIQDIAYGLNESGTTNYNMQQTYSETTVRDGETASGGSVFSFN